MRLNLRCEWPGHAANEGREGWWDDTLAVLENVREYTNAPKAYCQACTVDRDIYEAVQPVGSLELAVAELASLKIRHAELERALEQMVAAEVLEVPR